MMHASRSTVLAFMVLALTSETPFGFAQDTSRAEDVRESQPQRGAKLEEIVVTAQRHEQNVQDVPISMSVLDSEFLASQGVTDVREALLFAPNVKVESAGFFAAPRIRGFTVNNNNYAFEPPAGMAIDGVPYTNVAYFQSALFDIDRVEVLRGPQGTTFGKNTTAGVIQVITKDPADQYTGFVDLQYGELNRGRLESGVGGPLRKDLVNFRIAGLFDHRDGFVDNTTAALSSETDRHQRGRQRSGARGKLDFPDLYGSNLKITYEHIDLEDTGAGYELWHISPTVAAELRRYDPDADFVKNNYVCSLDAKDGRSSLIDKAQADWEYDLAGWSLNAVAAHSILHDAFDIDLDFTPSPASIAHAKVSTPTTTFELRGLSPYFKGFYGLERLFGLSLGQSQVLAGFFYQRRQVNHLAIDYRFRLIPFLRLTAAAAVGTGVTVPGLPTLPGIDERFEETVTQGFDQTADTLAGFGQFEWRFAERWMLQYGMRISNETTQAHWNSDFTSPTNVLLTAAGLQEFMADRELSELQFQPKVVLEYSPLENLNLFVHWARAFKGGGFNAFAYRPVADELQYRDESTTEWGMDAKTTLLDGKARVNFSLYRMDAHDFQVLTRLPQDTTLGLGVSKVENAKDARAQGFEGDVTWLPTAWLTLIATAGLNDTEYIDFPFNECPADRPNQDGDADPRCDASGRPFPFAPEWNTTLTPLLRVPLASLPGVTQPLPRPLAGIDLTADFTMEYLDVSYVDVDLDPRKRQPSFFRFRASVGLASFARGWSLKLTGENLTDEATSIRDGDLFSGVFISIPEQPRLFYAQLRWQF
jgi:iron complex outermembrane recepter protein